MSGSTVTRKSSWGWLPMPKVRLQPWDQTQLYYNKFKYESNVYR